MLTVPTHETPVRDVWAGAGRQGPRRHHADATAGHRSNRTARTAVGVADGVGDSGAAAFAATLVVDHAVREAALEGDAGAGVRAVGELLRSAGDLVTGDAAVVIVLDPVPGDPWWGVAWVGDCRAYAWDGRSLQLLTRDHTVAEQMRAGGLTANPRFEHVLSTSARTARPQEVGMVRIPAAAARSLLLISDGVHRVLDADRMATILGAAGGTARPADRAEWIVDAAEEAGTHDNATALVVDAALSAGSRIPAPRVPAREVA